MAPQLTLQYNVAVTDSKCSVHIREKLSNFLDTFSYGHAKYFWYLGTLFPKAELHQMLTPSQKGSYLSGSIKGTVVIAVSIFLPAK